MYGERRGAYRVLVGETEKDPGLDERITLKLIFEKCDREA
jgi:hypothetical protein